MTGQRWYAGTDPGHQYGNVLAFGTEEASDPPGAAERSIGDLLDPTRPGSVTDLINAVTKETGIDAAGWSVTRLLRMVARLEREAKETQAPDPQ